MRRFWRRRTFFSLLTIAAIAALFVWVRSIQDAFGNPAYSTGYLLLGLVLFLAAFSLRKKLPIPPLGAASIWLQFHIYAGWLVLAVFAVHVGPGLPQGWMESILYWLFVVTAASGVWGLWLSRRTPRLLAKLREEVVWERIPVLHAELLRETQAVVAELVQLPRSEALSDFFARRLVPFFVRGRGIGYRVWPSSRLRNSLRAELNALERYCPADQRAAHQRLGRLIDRQDDLQFHAAHQGWLKGWLFLHLVCTSLLLVFSALHVFQALTHRGVP